MSRLKRLKYKRKQNREAIKASMTSIVLALGIGTCGSLDTYAYFADEETVANDLNIQMGNLDVSIDNGLNVSNLNNKNIAQTKMFNIYNNGSLKQKIQVSIPGDKIATNIDKSYLQHIEYTLNMSYKGKKVQSINGNLNNLINKKYELRYEDGSVVFLEPNTHIQCSADAKLNTDITAEMSEKEIKFSLDVLSSQVNYKNDGNINENHTGFTDMASQNNFIKLDKKVENIEGNIHVKFDDKKEIDINIEEIIKKKGLRLSKVTVYPGGTGEFSEIKIDEFDNKEIDIVKKNGRMFDKDKFGSEFSDENKLMLQVDIIDSTEKKYTEIWEIKFRIINSKLEGYYKVISKTEPETVELENELDEDKVIIEETENNQEIIETPVVETPSKPEIEQPPVEKVPSEPEIEQKPIEEVPNKPELIEPPKEQEKTDIETQENPEI